jgi:mono/diheme cytochrome c family protein
MVPGTANRSFMGGDDRMNTNGIPFVAALLLVLLSACTRPEGAEIFRREGCGVCHRFGGDQADGRVDLSHVAGHRSDAWIKEQIRYPRIHKRDSGMPSFGHLSNAEMEALVHYIKHQANGSP